MDAHVTPVERTPGERWEWTQERYRDGMFSHAISSERQRLGLLQSVLDGHTRSRFTSLGLKPEDEVLEVGGGGGSVARWLAEQNARVTVTDLDTTFLEELAGHGVRVLRHDMYTEDFPPGSFDFIHARYVVIHLPDPDKAVARLVEWLKPGGVLLLEEPASFPLLDSPHPAYRTIMRAFRTHLEQSVGTDTRWARTLPVPLEKAGLVDIGHDARIQLVNGGDDEAEWWRLNLEQSRPAVVAAGLANDNDFEAAYQELASPHFHDLSLAVLTAWGRRAG
ncbi:methyltransferase domain-containing protein [Streptomyces sp. AK02-01A]|uniref:methyltransferase domain-containing protein n=1 Tax=Streptomyces sp. AK02-01A TaxID=3028648 RepID=UPI0029BD49B4|nr:methyltransferase domain-containing protein [Streptomyces sp. AK02-01A]MDX3849264.1 methyltransferase domain-containing protein [Streptomyces sp. AK02-01A]